MTYIIGVSTGTIKYVSDINARISIIKELIPDGIELSFPYIRDFLNIKLSNETLAYLGTLNYVSIHAPFKEVICNNEVITKLKELSDLINAKNVVFHKTGLDMELLKNSSIPYSLENNDGNKKDFKTFNEVSNYLENNKYIKITFDLAHAIQTDKEHITNFLELQDKITEIHFSIIHEGKHAPFNIYAKTDEYELLKKIPSVPIIIESAVNEPIELINLVNEIKLLKQNIT